MPPPRLPFELDATARELVIEGRRVRLAEKPFLVLEALAADPGRVVTREALRRRLWSDDTFVDFDNNLNSAVATLRQALGDRARSPRFIETVPRVGYRLIAKGKGQRGEGGGPPPGAPRYRRSAWVALGFAAGLLVAVAAASRVVGLADRLSASAHPAAQASYEQGRFLRAQYVAGRAGPANLEAAREAFRSAAADDPAFAAALAEEADTLVEMAFAGRMVMRQALEDARDLATQALDLEPASAVALRVAALGALFLDWELDAALSQLRRAWRLSARDARSSLALATALAAHGRHDEAVAAARRAVTLDPESFFVRADLAFFYLASGRAAEAAESCRRVLEVAPDFAPARHYALLAAERLGRWEEAVASARRLMTAAGATQAELARLDAREPQAALQNWRAWALARTEARAGEDAFAVTLALRHAALGDTTRTLELLERALERRDPMLVFVRAFPELAPLRGQPAFENLVSRIRPLREARRLPAPNTRSLGSRAG